MKTKLHRFLGILLAALMISASVLVSPPVVHSAVGDGLLGEYFDNPDFTNLKLRREDAAVNFSWGADSPDPSMQPDDFSVIWTGRILPEYSETYTFYIKVDGGVRLWVNGKLMIDKWSQQTGKEWAADMFMKAGTLHNIRIEYFNGTGNASIKLYWSSKSRSKQLIPKSRMSPTPALLSKTGWTASAQSYSSPHSPDKAIDSDATNTSYWDATPYPQWWKVDLGKIRCVKQVKIRNYVSGSRYYNYTIEASLDGTNWTTVASKMNTAPATDAGDLHHMDVLARYFRVNMTYNSANKGVHISDFLIYGYSDHKNTQYQITDGLTAYAEQGLGIHSAGTTPGYPPENAIDGNSATFWEGGQASRWVGIDLGGNYNVRQVNVSCYADGTRFYRYEIQASKDGVGWTTIASKRNNTIEPIGGITYDVNADARHLRVYVMHNSANNFMHISNISIWGFSQCKDVTAAPEKNINDIIQAEDCDYNSGFSFIDVPEMIDPIGQGIYGDYGLGKATSPSSAHVGDYLKFSNVNFGVDGADQFRIRARSDIKNAVSRIELRLDSLDGTLIGSMPLYQQFSSMAYETMSIDISNNGSPVTGTHDVYLKVLEVGEGGFGINWIQFVKKSPRPTPAPLPTPYPTPAGEFNIYFGNLHSHSAMSDGLRKPDSAYSNGRNTGNLDFLALTDHSNLFDEQFDWDKSRKWAELKISADSNTVNGSFVGIRGYELTWYKSQGHMNVYNTDFFDTAGNMEFDDVYAFYDYIKQYPAAICKWNHAWDETTTPRFNGRLPYDEDFDKVVYLIGARALVHPTYGPTYYYSHYIDALDKGWHVAPSGNEDNHNADWGNKTFHGKKVRTAILAESLTRDRIFDAIRQYRVYSTSDVNMQIFYRINGQIMGSTLSNPPTLNFNIRVTDPDTNDRITKIEILTEGGAVVHTHNCNSTSVQITPTLDNTKKYYFLRVTQADGEFAITAPVWTGK